MTAKPACEMSPMNTGTTCGAKASYLVSRGRRYDAQHSCRRHLAATVDALEQGEGRPVTVEVLRDDGRPGASPLVRNADVIAAALEDVEMEARS